MHTPSVQRLVVDIGNQKLIYQGRLGQALVAARDIGGLLRELKNELPHGEFIPVLQSLGLGIRLAQELMAVSRKGETVGEIIEGYLKCELSSHLTVPAALKFCRDPEKPPRKKDKTARKLLREIQDFELNAEIQRRNNRRGAHGRREI